MLNIAISGAPVTVAASASARAAGDGANAVPAISTAAPHMDLDGALMSRLAMISMRFQQALESMAAIGIKEQKVINAKIKALSEVLNAVQKLEVNGFSAADLNKTLDFSPVPPAISRAMADIRAQAEMQRATAIAAAHLAESAACQGIAAHSYHRDNAYKAKIESILAKMDVTSYTAEKNGTITFWGRSKLPGQTGEEVWEVFTPVRSAPPFYPQDDVDEVKNIYRNTQNDLSAAETAYKDMTAGGTTLRVVLYGLGIYKIDEKLPTSKDELKIATTKISDMVSSLQTTQATLTSDVSGVNNNAQQELTKSSEMLATYFSTIQRLIEAMH